jgi:hypothetical protein
MGETIPPQMVARKASATMTAIKMTIVLALVGPTRSPQSGHLGMSLAKLTPQVGHVLSFEPRVAPDSSGMTGGYRNLAPRNLWPRTSLAANLR